MNYKEPILTEELKEKIISMYKSGIENQSIMDRLNIGKGQLYSVLNANNIPRKQLKGSYKKLHRRFCKKCGAEITSKTAKYCSECGEYIITPKEIALNALEAMKNCNIYLPKLEREKYLGLISNVEDYIKSGEDNDNN